MLTDILFIAMIFVTRVALPIAITFMVGTLVNRAMRSAAPTA